METIVKTAESNRPHFIATGVWARYENLMKDLEFNQFGLISAAILIGSCLGGIAAMMVFQNDGPLWQFIIGLYASMANLVVCLAQAPARWVFRIFAASTLINAVILLINLPF